MLIKPGITADGFRTAVRDYTEFVVVEELAANSYDADATTVVVLLDAEHGQLHVIDDGCGFSSASFSEIAVLGAGDKRDIPFSNAQRHYLGSYGYGLKSTLNIATKVDIASYSKTEHLEATIDWSQLDDALRPSFEGFPCKAAPIKGKHHGTWITLKLRNPTTKTHLDRFGESLSNLPSDGGKFECYYGLYADVANKIRQQPATFSELGGIARSLVKTKLLARASATVLSDLDECSLVTLTDKLTPSVTASIYFTGLDGEKVRPLKTGLRGIYVRIHGRILRTSDKTSVFV